MNKYAVTFENQFLILEEDELLEFVKTAVIRNKDISSFSVQRIGSEPTRTQIIEAAFIRIFNL